VRYFHTRFFKYSRLRYAHTGACPGLPHTVCFLTRISYMTSHTAQLFYLQREALKDPIYTSTSNCIYPTKVGIFTWGNKLAKGWTHPFLNIPPWLLELRPPRLWTDIRFGQSHIQLLVGVSSPALYCKLLDMLLASACVVHVSHLAHFIRASSFSFLFCPYWSHKSWLAKPRVGDHTASCSTCSNDAWPTGRKARCLWTKKC
jgi:hypothetical protein